MGSPTGSAGMSPAVVASEILGVGPKRGVESRKPAAKGFMVS